MMHSSAQRRRRRLPAAWPQKQCPFFVLLLTSPHAYSIMHHFLMLSLALVAMVAVGLAAPPPPVPPPSPAPPSHASLATISYYSDSECLRPLPIHLYFNDLMHFLPQLQHSRRWPPLSAQQSRSCCRWRALQVDHEQRLWPSGSSKHTRPLLLALRPTCRALALNSHSAHQQEN
jgi:hypothetical protein